jgi:hypothetical protein
MIIGHNRRRLGESPLKQRLTRYSIAVMQIVYGRVLRIGITRTAGAPSLLLLCTLAFYFALCGVLSAKPTTAADPFQRYVIFYNELPITIYPVITAVEKENGAACGTSADLRRIIVNQGTRGAGIPTGGTVTVTLPKAQHCWYSAVRIYLFSVDLTEFETRIPADDRTAPDGATWNPPLCPNNACWTGTAAAQYPVDAPAQLFEYTMISQNPATGLAFPNPNNPDGIPLVDIDLSFVDSVYLPVAVNLDDGGATAYMGTTLPYTQFNQRTQEFLALKDPLNNPVWSQYAAYTAANWPHNVFNDLVADTAQVIGRDIVGDIRIIPPNIVPPASVLYTPPYTGPQQCSAVPMCSNLSGNCCPTDPPDPVLLACCGAPFAYLISNTTKQEGSVDNPSVDDLAARWTNWVRNNPCANLAAIDSWPGNNQAFNKAGFCRAFRQSVIFAWNIFYNSQNQVDGNGKPIPFTGCVNYSGVARDQCTVDAIIGFKSADKGVLNETVQALMRSVPYGPMGQIRWSFDKFILNWAPYNTVFNLFPYTRLVHNATDGLDAPGAYAFSIDDRFGNYQNRASGFLIDVGGSAKLLNQTPYDFWEQYRVAFAAGWNHATVCGRPLAIPNQLGSNGPISFWQNGVHQNNCDLAFYKTAAETGPTAQFAKFRVGEASKQVTDLYTGLTQTVTELTYDQAYCTANSAPALVRPPVSICTNSKIVPTLVGAGIDPGEAYVSLSDTDKPLVTLTLPPPAVGLRRR